MKMKNVTRRGNAAGNALLPTIGSSSSRRPTRMDSNTACPFPGNTLGLPTNTKTRKRMKADITQPVAMLLVMAQPLPKSTSLAAAGATPSPSEANETVATDKAAQNPRNFLTVCIIYRGGDDQEKGQ